MQCPTLEQQFPTIFWQTLTKQAPYHPPRCQSASHAPDFFWKKTAVCGFSSGLMYAGVTRPLRWRAVRRTFSPSHCIWSVSRGRGLSDAGDRAVVVARKCRSQILRLARTELDRGPAVRRSREISDCHLGRGSSGAAIRHFTFGMMRNVDEPCAAGSPSDVYNVLIEVCRSRVLCNLEERECR